MMTGPVLWSWEQLCAALSLPVQQGPNVYGLAFDSRQVQSGDLFIALSGDPGGRFTVTDSSNRDGHDFVANAEAQGAVGALVCKANVGTCPQLRVIDTYEGLWAIGAAARSRYAGNVVAITGSSGKTTLKTLLSGALDCHASVASFNNHIGVPLTLARMPPHDRFAVVEIGTNHPGEIAPLSKLTKPNVAVLLNVLGAHIGNFPGFAALQGEKLSIADGLDPDGTFVLPLALRADSGHRGPHLTFADQPGADVQVANVDGDHCELRVAGQSLALSIPGGGAHRALTCAAGVAVALALGLDLPKFVARLGRGSLPAGRGSVVQVGGVRVIDDSYNANPVSMSAALDVLRAAPAVRRVALLGDMLELGADEVALHEGLAAACMGIDAVFCVGARMRRLFEKLPAAQRLGHEENASALGVAAIAALLRPGDCLLVKGSNRLFWANNFVQRLIDELKKSPALEYRA